MTRDDRPRPGRASRATTGRARRPGAAAGRLGDGRHQLPPRRRSRAARRRGRRCRRPCRSRPQHTGFSLAASTGTALRMVVPTSSLGPSRGLARRGLAHDPAEREHVAARDVAREVLDVLVGRRADELLGRAELHDRAVAHDRDPVAEPERLGEVVRDEDHRLADLLLEPHDLVLHVAADERVERAERLVVEHHLRVDGERARDADALLHAARELVGELVGDVLEPDEREDLARPRVPVAPCSYPGPRARTRRCRSRAGARAARSAGRPSRPSGGAAPGARPCSALHHVAAGDLDLAGGRLDQPDQRAHERRLARSRTGP